MEPDFADQIGQRGYWRVHFRPRSSADRLSSLQEAEQAVTSSVVRLRGWPYPYAARQQGLGSSAIERHSDYVLGWIDWDQHREFWRMYQSSQYINYRGLHEDWLDRVEIGPPEPFDPDALELRVLGAIVQIVEFFAFLGRLRERGLYGDGVDVDIALKRAGPRSLRADESRQLPFMFDKITHAAEVRVQRALSGQEGMEVGENSVDALLEFFDKFEWNPLREQISSQVESYLTGRLF